MKNEVPREGVKLDTGKPRTDLLPFDALLEVSEVLDYGGSLSYGGIACLSAKSGITCQNAEGHGFFLSRKQQKLF